MRTPVARDGQALGVARGQPRRRGRRRRREVDRDAARVEQVEHPVQPPEVELAGPRLEQRPREDADRHEVHPGGPP
jgi:hypothetical protein